MHDKDPGFWAVILGAFGPEVRSAVMAVIISILRIAYDQDETRWQRIGLEALLCGALAYGFSSGLAALTLDPGLAVFCGSAIGFFGVEFVRNRAKKLVDKKIEGQR